MLRRILAIVGSASANSSNSSIVKYLGSTLPSEIDFIVVEDLKHFPHFDPEKSSNNPPQMIVDFRNQVNQADAIIICSPEYVFSIPSGLKNILEWSVATTIFTDKPVGLITASANGSKGHEEMNLIMKTLGALVENDTSVLIQGVKGKVSTEGEINQLETKHILNEFIKKLIHRN